MISRPIYIDKIMSYVDTPFIKIISGIRRCGKSTILKLIMQKLKFVLSASLCGGQHTINHITITLINKKSILKIPFHLYQTQTIIHYQNK